MSRGQEGQEGDREGGRRKTESEERERGRGRWREI